MKKKYILFVLTALLTVHVNSQNLPELALSPPMGWNSWDCFGMDITDVELKATADYMAKHLKKYGWKYVVLDMGWYYMEGLNTSNFKMKDPPQHIDEYGRLIPAPREFPSAADGKGLKPVADYIHGKGLKFGLHIMRGIPRQAVEKNTPIKGTRYTARDIASEERLCSWYHGMYTIDMTKPGAQEYYNSIFELYAEWGVDFIKADNMLNPYHPDEIEAVRKAIDYNGRPMVISLSAGPVSVERAEHIRQNAHMWRITNDMWDDWSFIEKTFGSCREWQSHITPNHWPDADMLPFGKLRINATDGLFAKAINVPFEQTINEYCRLSKDEQYTVMTLWSIYRSPLMMGGNLMENDKFTLSLLTNKEVIRVNQHSTNNRELRYNDNESIWIADDPGTGNKYLAFFNIGEKGPLTIKLDWNELGISGKYKVRDLWKKKNIGSFEDSFEGLINSHGCGFYKLTKI